MAISGANVAMAALVATAMGGTYVLGRDQSAAELQAYKAIRELGTKELAADLRAVSSALKADLTIYRRNKVLAAENDRLRKTAAVATARFERSAQQLASLKRINTDMRTRLETLTGDVAEFSIEREKALAVQPRLLIGFPALNSLTVNGVEHHVAAGAVVRIKDGARICELRVTDTSSTSEIRLAKWCPAAS